MVVKESSRQKKGLNQHEVSRKENVTKSKPSTSHSDLQFSLSTDIEIITNYVSRESLENLYEDCINFKNYISNIIDGIRASKKCKLKRDLQEVEIKFAHGSTEHFHKGISSLKSGLSILRD